MTPWAKAFATRLKKLWFDGLGFIWWKERINCKLSYFCVCKQEERKGVKEKKKG